MQLEYFPYILEIGRQKSVSAAAKALNLRQTTLSSILSSVEEEVGFSIFCRTPNGMVPTILGEQFLATLHDINVQTELLYSLTAHEGVHAQPVHVVVTPATSAGIALELTRRFHVYELKCDLFFEEQPRPVALPMILQGNANICLFYVSDNEIDELRQEMEEQGLYVTPLYATEFCGIVKLDHPLAAHNVLTKEELSAYPIITATGFFSGGARFSRWASQHCSITSVPNFYLLQSIMEQENMLGVGPAFTLAAANIYDPSRHKLLHFSEDLLSLRMHFCLIQREESYLRYQEKILINEILEYFSSFSPLQHGKQLMERGTEN